MDDLRLLEKIYARILAEAAVSPMEAAAGGLALLATDAAGTSYLVLYKSNAVSQAFHQLAADIRPIDARDLGVVMAPYADAAIVAAMTISMGSGDPEVEEVMTRVRGYGPLLYDAAMVLHGGLSPSSGLVSAAARGVWKKYAGRPDVVVTPRKPVDLEEPSRPEELNVAIRHRKPNRAPVKALMARHDEVVDALSTAAQSRYHIAGDIAGMIERSLTRAAGEMLRTGAR